MGLIIGTVEYINQIRTSKKIEREQLKNSLEELEVEYQKRQNKRYQIEEEIAMLEDVIAKRQDIAYNLEMELDICNDDKRKQIILGKLITLDKQTFKDKQRLYKLLEDLDE